MMIFLRSIKKLDLVYFGVLLFGLSFHASAQEIKYPNIDGIGKDSIGYAVLELALDKSGLDYSVSVDKRSVNQNRAKVMVESGELDVFDIGFHKKLEKKLLPVYLPLEMGLLGWRIPIVHRDTEKELQSVKDLYELTQFTVGQGQGWGDIPILEDAGFKVVTASKIENLIRMADGKRFDLFPLGAVEVYQFLEKFGINSKNLVVNSNVTIVYPYGRFFYVNKGNKPLANAIKLGMEQALSDGSLIRLLEKHPFSKDAFGQAKLSSRLKLYIKSPETEESFKQIDERWWFKP